MLRNLNRVQSGRRVLGTPFVGTAGANIPATGRDGPALAYSSLTFPTHNAALIRFEATSIPAGGTLTASEDTAFTFAGRPDGTAFLVGNVYADNVLLGAVSHELRVGSGAPVTLAGANLEQAGQVNAGAIVQGHLMAGANLEQQSQTTAGGIAQTHRLTGANLEQTTQTTAGAIGQGHVLGGANLEQPGQMVGGAVNPPAVVLGGANLEQSGEMSGGAIGSGFTSAPSGGGFDAMVSTSRPFRDNTPL